MTSKQKITVALVDDHTLFRDGLSNLLSEYDDICLLFSAKSVKEMQNKLKLKGSPNIILMDINMPVVDGHEAALWLKNCSAIKILALSMYEDDSSIIRMLKNGARGYILKECNSDELVKGIRIIHESGYFINELISGRLIHAIKNENSERDSRINITSRELQFLQFCCSELTYKEIASQMGVSPRTVDNYREELFDKLQIKSRTGLVIYAIKNNLVQLNK